MHKYLAAPHKLKNENICISLLLEIGNIKLNQGCTLYVCTIDSTALGILAFDHGDNPPEEPLFQTLSSFK
jgi:hypothetical protein